MMKNKTIFSFLLVASLMIFATGFASAVNITSPQDGDFVSGTETVSWENGTFQTASLLVQGGNCSVAQPGGSIVKDPISSSKGTAQWDTTSTSNGDQCLKIAKSGTIFGNTSVVVDSTSPSAEFNKSIFVGEEGKNTTVTVNVTDSLSGIKNWTIEFGDGNSVNGTSSGVVSLNHTYSQEDEYNLTLEVLDNAENSVSEESKAIVTMPNPDWVIRLDKGINYVSVPFVPKRDNQLTGTGTVLEDIRDNVDVVWGYQFDSSSGANQWLSASPSSAFGRVWQGNLDSVEPLHGYVFNMDEKDVFYGEAETSSSGQPKVPQKAKVNAGSWNLIGISGSGSISSSQLNNKIGTGNPATTLVQNVLEGQSKSSTSSLDSGESYWLSTWTNNQFMNNDGSYPYFP